jgi:hypothetical protein
LNAPRHSHLNLIILAAFAVACGRIASAQFVQEPLLSKKGTDPNEKGRPWPAVRPQPMPTFGSNDRSRWAVVHALVDHGTFVVGKRDKNIFYGTAIAPIGQLDPIAAAATVRFGREWRAKSDSGIIFNDGWGSVDKVLHPSLLEFHSTKPPFLTVLVAGLYWLLKTCTFWMFGAHWTLATHPFAIVRTIVFLINALPFLVYLVVLKRIVLRWTENEWTQAFVLIAAAFGTTVTPFLITFNNHTPATFCVLFALVLAARIDDGYGGWEAHAGAGLLSAFAVTCELPALAFAAAAFALCVWRDPKRALLAFVPAALLITVGFFAANWAAFERLRPAYSEFGGQWYEYEGSHWVKPPPGEVKTGIDWAAYHESRGQYAMHLLIGHHGLFSLTPIWFLSIAGAILLCRRGFRRPPGGIPGFLGPLTLLLTVVVVGFYLVISDNYGGWTNGLRWLMWLSPLWLLSMIPALDALSSSKWGRGFAMALLGVSIFSAHYSLWNPWRHPWLYDLLIAAGWPGY